MIVFEIGFSNNNIVGAHSHNDYKNEYPLDAAFKHKFKSIEVDIFLIKNKLYVGHSWFELRKTKTIEKMYLDPLWKIYKENNKSVYSDNSVYLLVDIKTTSYGTGQLIENIISEGMKKIILFIGGSATNDVGIGMLDALGFSFRDYENKKLTPSVKNLSKIYKIEKSPIYDSIKKIKFIVACDVANPLIGPNGATQTFGKQKGASDKELRELEENVIHFSKIVIKEFKRDYTKHDGAGAAGGVGFAALSFLNAEFEGGFKLISKLLNLKDKIKKGNYDYIITGEGCIDEQTQYGKLLKHVADLGKKHSTPVIAFTGKLKKDLSHLNLPGLTIANQITPKNTDLDTAIRNTSKNLNKAINEEMFNLLN